MGNDDAIDAAIFDFNGTLCDDEPLLLDIFTRLFQRHLGWELTPEDYYGRLAGRSDREIVETVVRERIGADDDGLVTRLLAQRGEDYRARTSRTPPVRESTKALVRELTSRGVRLAIVTGAQRGDVEHVLALTEMTDAFAPIVAAEDVRHGKPDPEGMLQAAALLGVRPSEVVVFEDSRAGVNAARASGMRCIGVTGTHARRTLESADVPVVDVLSPRLLDAPAWKSR